jgi:hypothetical protein
MTWNPARERLRHLTVLREALRRMRAHDGTFTVADFGAGIDGMLMPGAIPKGVSRVVPRLVGLGHVVRLRHGLYSLAADGEVGPRRLSRGQKRRTWRTSRGLGTSRSPFGSSAWRTHPPPNSFEPGGVSWLVSIILIAAAT